MNDSDGPLLADIFYRRLFATVETDGVLHPDAVPYALDDAIQTLKAQGVPVERWALFIHLGV